jgi:hypothetical protein
MNWRLYQVIPVWLKFDRWNNVFCCLSFYICGAVGQKPGKDKVSVSEIPSPPEIRQGEDLNLDGKCIRVAAIRVLLVDDHEVARRSIRSVLSREANLDVIGETADGEEAVKCNRRCAQRHD